jgi:hypothetical protein
MDEEWQPDAIVDLKLSQVQKEMAEYIRGNSERIDTNIPVFFGHVEGILEKSFPVLSDTAHDRFIDEVTVLVIEESKRSKDVEYIEKLFSHAIRTKRKPGGRMIFDIILGIKQIDNGHYLDAIDRLKKFRTVDAIICTAIAYCYYVLGEEQNTPEKAAPVARPGDMALQAREQMIELARLRPPVNRLRFPQIVQELRINKIFWMMIRLALEWFPQEPQFFKIGLEKATKDGNREMRGELLKLAAERYYNDMFFLRELYHFKIEERDASGAAAVVKQMMQQHPDELEPVYYGLQLSIVSSQTGAYARFRNAAVSKRIPANVLLLLDFAFEIVSGRQVEAFACLEDIKKRLINRNHYVILIEYVARDIFSGDEKRERAAKRVLLDSLDQYCLMLLRMKEIPEGS